MIPNTSVYVVKFKLKDGFRTVPIVAWDDLGYPMVAGRTCLERANYLPGFAGLDDGAFELTGHHRGPVWEQPAGED